ncbi:hypothetical protein BCR41DRAFT_215544 [Lobosporangium transversale]|uniref:Ion transport domain-containing protein n=1 Tax=Lobosporangium transversale TaxID=64571 RepID=A0A1Y2G6W3_9FUNG|nr:hypothetical protein BCR41DRAFT_215544 [Lobosporangium transversale]ORY99578.1 hypothetical protein BCR41DRAFT_215544 [Lobosporangium transversale]|eukprot:XP_021875873.1 hypothetical protein BCR41DRAFT_215544 [Lobosporangium transversale]
MLIDTLQGCLCAWVTPREILILDLKMAQVFQHINRDDSAPEEDLVVLSPDGTMLATAFGKHVSIYMTHMDGSIRSSEFKEDVVNLSFLDGGRQLLVGLISGFAILVSPWHPTESGRRLWLPRIETGKLTVAHIRKKGLVTAQGHPKKAAQGLIKAFEGLSKAVKALFEWSAETRHSPKEASGSQASCQEVLRFLHEEIQGLTKGDTKVRNVAHVLLKDAIQGVLEETAQGNESDAIQDIFGDIQGFLKSVTLDPSSRAVQGLSIDVFQGLSKEIQGLPKEAQGLLKETIKGLSKEIQECFKKSQDGLKKELRDLAKVASKRLFKDIVENLSKEATKSQPGKAALDPKELAKFSSIKTARGLSKEAQDRFKRTVDDLSKKMQGLFEKYVQGLSKKSSQGLCKETVQDLLAYRQGPGLDVCILKDSSQSIGPCDAHCQAGKRLNENFVECTGPSGRKFMLEIQSMVLEQLEVTALTTRYQYRETIILSTPGDDGAPEVIHQANHYGVTESTFKAFFLPCNTRYIVVGEHYIQIWKLPDANRSVCELLAMRSIPYGSQQNFEGWLPCQPISTCRHRNTIHIGNPEEWMTSPSIAGAFDYSPETLTGQENLEACIQSIPYLIQIYGASDDQSHQREILSFVLKHINGFPDPHNYTECVIRSIIDAFDVKECEQFLKELLLFNKDGPTWIPRRRLGENVNLISFIIKKAEGHPKLASTARIVIDYCCWMAKSQKEPGYLSLVIEAIPVMVQQAPDVALEAMRKMAFIPVKRHNFVVNRSKVCRPLTIKRLLLIDRFFPKRTPLSIYKGKKPVFQLKPFLPSHQTRQEEGVQDNESFKADVYVASFDMLWNIEAPPIKRIQRMDGQSMSPWKMLLWIAHWKAKPRSFQYVRIHALGLEYFDHPAIKALIEYKWDKFASSYWLARFFFQCIYYLMVLMASFLQVYAEPSTTVFLLICIVAMAVMFLWLEVIQCLGGPRRYIKNAFNIVDICAYVLPLSASIVQLVTLVRGEGDGNSRVFSFAILAVYWHILFELRVIQGVCHTVTIILRVARKIKVFFIIFAASILAFAHTFLHLLWAKAIDSEDRTENAANFPRDFLGALSATYFFMGGRYDPVSDKFGSNDLTFHIIMALYFFTTVILILNVLIALINMAFTTVDKDWHSQWLKNLYLFVWRAENMSYHTPGFRSAYHWFPKEIYYTASQKDVEDYYKKYFGDSVGFSTMPTNIAIKMATNKAADMAATGIRTSISWSNTNYTSGPSLSSPMSRKELRFKKAVERAMAESSTKKTPATTINTSIYADKKELSQQLGMMQREFQSRLDAIQDQANQRHLALERQLRVMMELLQLQLQQEQQHKI